MKLPKTSTGSKAYLSALLDKVSLRRFRRLASLLCILAGSLTFFAILPVRAASIRYAQPVAVGLGDCSNWDNACTLQTALSGVLSGDEIWVGAGTHLPGAQRSDTFQLVEGVAVYGGFNGTEAARNERDPALHVTILSGDLAGNDAGQVIQDEPTRSENAYHVVIGADGALLDGVTITGGNASDADVDSPDGNGGGMYNLNSSPTLNQVILVRNTARFYGGGMHNHNSGPVLTQITFQNNNATWGGGLSNLDSALAISGAYFDSNVAVLGGGMLSEGGSNTLTDVTFYNNIAVSGGGIHALATNITLTNALLNTNRVSVNGGGIFYTDSSDTDATLTNVTFVNNQAASNGGGMFDVAGGATLTNITFYNNTSALAGGLWVQTGASEVRNAIFWDNTPQDLYRGSNLVTMSVRTSVIEGGCPGGLNLFCDRVSSADPRLGVLGNYSGPTQTVPLHFGSSARNTGDPAYCTQGSDQRGVAYVGVCDIGAYEFNFDLFYVKQTATGNADCESWANACALQTALQYALSGDDIWVMEGTYKPTTDFNRNSTFQLKDGVTLYGGFAGNETSLDQRNLTAHHSVLSGDLNGDDGVNFANYAENSYHVVTGVSGAILDGFTISGGNATGSPWPRHLGGGMIVNNSSPTLVNIIFQANRATSGGGMALIDSSPTLTNVTFSANSAENGGGLYEMASTLDSSFPVLAHVTFVNNTASNNGGGLYTASGNLTLRDVTFDGNVADNGGGMSVYLSSIDLKSVTFSNNTAADSGGGVYLGQCFQALVTNSTFRNNSASVSGGGIYSGDCTTVQMLHVTISGNSVNSFLASGGGMFNLDTSPVIINSIFWGNTATGTLSDEPQIGNSGTSGPAIYNTVIQGGCPADSICGDIVTADPLLGVFNDYGGLTKTYPLLPGSSAIDVANSYICTEPTWVDSLDQRGMPRTGACDAGAYEVYAGIYYVKPAASGAENCMSWDDACALQTALAASGSGSEIWVAAGTYKPTVGTDRNATFQLKNNVAVYGGFAGTETLRSEHDPAVHVTILSGDLNSNDNSNVAHTEPTRSDNVYHVVTGVTGATLDGFTITGGNANAGGNCPGDCGGGLYNYSSSPTLSNLIFSANTSLGWGGGLTNHTSNPRMDQVSFVGNATGWEGGGMANLSSNPEMTNLTFRNNLAGGSGGGLANLNCTPTVNFATFENNNAHDGAGIYNYSSSPSFTNVTISGGFATAYGGGMYNKDNSSPILTHLTITGIWAGIDGSGIYNQNGSNPQIRNTILWGSAGSELVNSGSTPNIRNSVVDGGCPAGSNCTAIITANPMLYSLGNFGGPTQTFPLLPGSSALNATSADCATLDQRGVLRNGPPCDIGAFESRGFTLTKSGGDNQATRINTAFANPLAVSVSALDNEPVDGGRVTLTAPATGASTTTTSFSLTIWSGAVSQVVTANGTLGNYAVTASAVGATSVDFALSNINLPTASTAAASAVTLNSATLNGWVNPNNSATTVTFEYGLTTSYGSTATAAQSPVNGLSSVAVNFPLTDLAPDTVYHYRVKAENGVGIVYGANSTFTTTHTPGLRYAKPTPSGLGNCTSWADACTLETALTRAISGDEIWVMAGTHYPTIGTDRNATFQLHSGVAVYGGFAGTETERNQRDNAYYQTVLSGEIATSANTDNSLHVVTSSGVDSTAILNGFTITGGNANSGANGGGMYNMGGSPTLANLLFLNNLAGDGGGMYNASGSPSLTNVVFSGNMANDGGGMFNTSASPILTHVTFSNNQATGTAGGAMTNRTGSSPQIRNAIFWGNTPGQMNNVGGSSAPPISNSLVQGGCPFRATCAGLLVTTNPLFVNAAAHDLRLEYRSPAIDTANNAYCTSADLDGLPRPTDGEGDNTLECDMGAYESGDLICGLNATSSVIFALQSSVGIDVQDSRLGTLSCLYVDERERDHPNATGTQRGQGTRTGRYWHILGLESDRGTTANHFMVSLTLPHDSLPDPEACKYPGGLGGQGWDCASTGSNSSAVTRAGISSFSDWAVGTQVGPTAVSLTGFQASSASQWPGLAVLCTLTILAGATVWRWRR